MTSLFAPPLWVLTLGWVLLHFLWQGTVIAAVYTVLRSVSTLSQSPAGRYALACTALGAMGAAPVITLLHLLLGGSMQPHLSWTLLELLRPELISGFVAAWITGATLLSLRIAAGWHYSHRLRSSAHPAPAYWQSRLRELAARLAVKRPIRLLVSTLVDVPVVVGWFRPAILIPLSTLSGMPMDQLLTLLAHELAHIRRNDHFVVIIQNVIESTLFYHPAVWWVSRHLRIEREYCCDDLVLHTGGDTLTYAEALACLEIRREHTTSLLAADGASLVVRMRRLVALGSLPLKPQPVHSTLWTILLFWLVGTGFAAATPDLASIPPVPLLSPAPSPLLYDPFLPSPQALRQRYGVPHTALPNGPDLLRPVPVSLSNKYGSRSDVLRGTPVRLRHDATSAPIPAYPLALSKSGQHGIVIAEVVVAPTGRVQESKILATFHPDASQSVTYALTQWRFLSVPQLATRFDDWKPCGDCIRIGRLGFEFRLSPGAPRVVDLAGEQIRHQRLTPPFRRNAGRRGP